MMTPELPHSILELAAVVYVRQSTMAQVAENLESQRRQYALVETAQLAGFRRVEVIDDDLGISASGAADRPGFERLIAMLRGREVGAVFCLEASRLARNGRDWHYLLDLCGIVGTYVVDGDGVYDPGHPNDRLLLGMKGSISEFELTTLRSRMLEGQRAKAARGELRIGVPIGFVWGRDETPRLDPDIRLQEVIRTIFQKFAELGSARQVLLWMGEHDIHFPRPSDGHRMTSFDWRPVRYRNVVSVLKNPFYAGAYAYGKKTFRTDVRDGRAIKQYGCKSLPISEWRVLIEDHHEGYISWSQYEENQQQLARNAFGLAGGAAKSGRGGKALLPGLLRCRRCGHVLSVIYAGRTHAPKYRCGRHRDQYGEEWCIQFGASAVDRVVSSAILEAVQPLAVEAAIEAKRQVDERRDEARRLHELELTQARYEAELAERRYASCDPSNRLVAAQLEVRWEECMRRVAEIQGRLADDVEDSTLVEVEKNLNGLGADLAAAWGAPCTTPRTRQRIVKTLIEEIVVDVDEDRSEVVLIIHWRGGQHSRLTAHKPGTGEHGRRASEEAVDIIRSMAGNWPDEQIAATLNRLGFVTGTGKTWNARRVTSLRRTRSIRAYRPADDECWVTMSRAAELLGVSNHVVRRLIKNGVLPAKQVVQRAPYQIRASDLDNEHVKRAVDGPCRPNPATQNLEIPGT